MSSSTTLPTDLSPIDGNLSEDNTLDDINFDVSNTNYEVRTLGNLAQSGDDPALRVFYTSIDGNNMRFTTNNNKYLSARFNLRRYNLVFLFLNSAFQNSQLVNNTSLFIKNIKSDFLRIENSVGEMYLFLDNVSITDTPFTYDSIIPLLDDIPADISSPLTYDDLTFTTSGTVGWKISEVTNVPGTKNYFIEENDNDKIFSINGLNVGQSTTMTISSTKLLFFELRLRWSIENSDSLSLSYGENSFSRNGGYLNYFNGETFLVSADVDNDLTITFTKNSAGNNLNEIYFYFVNITDVPPPPPPSLPFPIIENLNYEGINYNPNGSNNNWIQKYLKDLPSGIRFIDDVDKNDETIVFSCEGLVDNQDSQLTLTPNSNTYFSANLNLRWNTEFQWDYLIIRRGDDIINIYTGPSPTPAVGSSIYLGTTIFIDNISIIDSISIQYIKDFTISSVLNTVYFYLSDVTFSPNIETPPFITSEIEQDNIIYNPINLFRWNSRQIGQARFLSDDPDQQVFFCDGFFTGRVGTNSSGLEIYPADNTKYLSGQLYFRASNKSNDNQIFEIKFGNEIFSTIKGNNSANYLGTVINIINITSNNKLTISYNKLDVNNDNDSASSSGRDNCYFYFDNIQITDDPLENPNITEVKIIDGIEYNPASNIKKWFVRKLNDLGDTIFEDDKTVDVDNTTIFICENLDNNQFSHLIITPENSLPFSKVLNIRYSCQLSDNLCIYRGTEANPDNQINFYGEFLSSSYLGTSVIIEDISDENPLIIEYFKNSSIAEGLDQVYFYFTDITVDLLKTSGNIDTLNYSPESLQRWRYQEIGNIKSENDNENQEVFICDGFFNNNQNSTMKFSHDQDGFLSLELKLRRSIRNIIDHRIEILINDSIFETVNSNSNIYSLSFDETTHTINNITRDDNFTIRYFKNGNNVSSNRDAVYFYFDNISYLEIPTLPRLVTSPVTVDGITYQPGGLSVNWIQRQGDNDRIEFSCDNLTNNSKSSLRLFSSTPKSFKLHLFWGTELNFDFVNLYQEGIKIARFSGNNSNTHLSQILFIKNLHLFPLTIEYLKDTSGTTQPDNVYFYLTDIIDSLLTTIIRGNLFIDQNITVPTNWNNLLLNPTSDLKNWRITSLNENKLITDDLNQEVVMCPLTSSSYSSLTITKTLPFVDENNIILNLRHSLVSTSSFTITRNDQSFFTQTNNSNRLPNPGYSGISIPLEFGENDTYVITYNKNNNDSETFNTVYFFFSSSSQISTPSLKITAKLCSECP